ncbi:MAG: polysaccharide biosynthesis C-terminal domain-containing protein, partial [Janthinobacterium lividum]
ANLASASVGTLMLVLYLGVTVLAFTTGIGRTPTIAGHAYNVAILLTIIPAAWILRRLPPGDVVPAGRRMLQFGMVTMLINSANLLNLWADRLVIGVMTDARSVGIYQIASQLAVVAIVVRSAVTSVFESRVPKVAATGATVPEITREYSQATRLLLHVSAPGLVCLALTAGFWTETLFGHAYRAAALPLAVLVLGQLATCFIGPSVNALHMTGGEHSVMRLTIATSIMNVLGNIALIPLLGLVGSAIAFGVANFAVSGACLFQLWRTERVRLHAAMLGDIVLATIAATGATALAAHWLGASLPAVIGDLVVCYVVYAILVALLCRTEDEALDFARSLRRRLGGDRRTQTRMPIQ